MPGFWVGGLGLGGRWQRPAGPPIMFPLLRCQFSSRLPGRRSRSGQVAAQGCDGSNALLAGLEAAPGPLRVSYTPMFSCPRRLEEPPPLVGWRLLGLNPDVLPRSPQLPPTFGLQADSVMRHQPARRLVLSEAAVRHVTYGSRALRQSTMVFYSFSCQPPASRGLAGSPAPGPGQAAGACAASAG